LNTPVYKGKASVIPPRSISHTKLYTTLDAKRAIADHLGMPLAKLMPEQLEALNALLVETLAKPVVWDHVRHHLDPIYRG
jgi:hypothetical protein